ncbi:unnamed protein product, partial [Candidula unifasciata]
EKLTDDEMREITDAFRQYDKNEDGSISCEELGCVLRSFGQNPTQAELKELIKEMDPNKNGRIEFKEFVDGMSRRGIKSQEQEEDELLAAFRVFDRDDNGYITAPELRHVMTSCGEPMTDDEVDKMIEEADVDEDGRVNYQEFVRMMASRP